MTNTTQLNGDSGVTSDPSAPASSVVNVDLSPNGSSSPSSLRAVDVVRRRSRAARRELVIPEWENLRLFFGTLTVADLEALRERDVKNDLELNLVLVIVKAENEDGTPIFAMGDLHFLRTEAPLSIMQRIIDFMFNKTINLPTPAEEADRIALDPDFGSA